LTSLYIWLKFLHIGPLSWQPLGPSRS